MTLLMTARMMGHMMALYQYMMAFVMGVMEAGFFLQIAFAVEGL
jgi:hypothetical protein